MLNLNDLRLFALVVDHGGFAPAARHLAVPKSTLSKRVAALESQLGVRLLQRTSRSFSVTEAGRDLHRHATAMLVEAEAAEHTVRGRMAEPTGTVRITASVPTAQLLLAPLLPGLARALPKVGIVLQATDRFVDIVQEGIDIALRSHFAPLPDSGLVQRQLEYDPGWLVASPAYLLERGEPSQPEDLASHDGLLVDPGQAAWRLADGHGRTTDATPFPRFHADEAVVLLEAARAGLGIACLPAKLCRALIAGGVLRRVLPDWNAGGVTTTLLMPHRRGLLPSVRAVADFLVEQLRSGDSQAGRYPVLALPPHAPAS
jgi:DNA-binding transcriptional LysR family regulator